MTKSRMLNPTPDAPGSKPPPGAPPTEAKVMEVEVIVSRVKCGRCGHQFFPRALKGGKTRCPGCGDWMAIPKVNLTR